ncbi:MAG TPA: MFS transporter, partial [Lacipirellulaceae bacterium]|nr:MFS transporter [Lacipirellulaceae bacterium]
MSLTAVAPVRHELQFDPATFPDATPAASDGTRRRADSGVFYGWLMVLLTTVVLIASSPGQTFGFTYFNPSLRQALSISQTELSVTYLCATLVAALPLGYCGAVVDRVGLKRSMLAAVAAMSAACLLSAAVQNVPMLFVACLAMRLVGPGVMTLLANNTLAAWFDARLGAATSVLQLGMAAAMALAPLGIMTLIAQVGWRQSYAVLGAILAVGVFPLVWWAFREDPRELGQTRDGLAGPLTDGQAAGFRRDHTAWAAHESPADAASYDLRAARRTAAFWVFLMATSVWSLIGTGYVFHLQPLLESRGLTPAAIAWATPLMASAMATMQLAGGRLADRLDLARLAASALTLVAAASVILAVGRGGALLAAYGIYGLGQGLMALVSTTVWARYFGRAHLGRIRGTVLTVAISASAVGPLAMGIAADYFGGFEPSLWLFAAMALATSAICPLAQRPMAAAP